MKVKYGEKKKNRKINQKLVINFIFCTRRYLWHEKQSLLIFILQKCRIQTRVHYDARTLLFGRWR